MHSIDKDLKKRVLISLKPKLLDRFFRYLFHVEGPHIENIEKGKMIASDDLKEILVYV